MSSVAILEDRAVIGLSGPETRDFLQGLVTNDVRSLAPGKPLYAALLTPQGKVLFDFILSEGDGGVSLDCAAAVAEPLMKRLQMYRLRSKVTVDRRTDLAVVASWGGSGSSAGDVDPRLVALGRRSTVPREQVPKETGGAELYLAHRLKCGVPDGNDFGQDRMFALDADLDELHAISFEKGCYVGQELTARMKHRGTARKRLLPVSTLDGSPLLSHESPVLAGAYEIGSLVSSYGSCGFALIRLDRLAESGPSITPQIDSQSVRIIWPPWLSA